MHVLGATAGDVIGSATAHLLVKFIVKLCTESKDNNLNMIFVFITIIVFRSNRF